MHRAAACCIAPQTWVVVWPWEVCCTTVAAGTQPSGVRCAAMCFPYPAWLAQEVSSAAPAAEVMQCQTGKALERLCRDQICTKGQQTVAWSPTQQPHSHAHSESARAAAHLSRPASLSRPLQCLSLWPPLTLLKQLRAKREVRLGQLTWKDQTTPRMLLQCL